MTNKKKMFFALAGIMAVLAGLGLVVVGVAAPACEGDSNWFLKRQIVYLLLGVAGTIGVACIPWNVWLRAAPYLFVAVLFCLCLGFTRRTDVFTLGVPIIMLFVAWLKSKLKIGTMPILTAFYIGLAGFLAVTVLANPNRRERLKVWMGLVEEKAGSSVKPNWRATNRVMSARPSAHQSGSVGARGRICLLVLRGECSLRALVRSARYCPWPLSCFSSSPVVWRRG